jgi:hypothetical protein
MRSLLHIRPLIYGAALFVAGLTVGTSLASWASAPSHIEVQEGTTLVNFLPEAVVSLTYATPRGMTTAQRSTPGTPFHVLSTFADGRAVQRCTAPMDMEEQLETLTTLTARRSLSPEQRGSEFPIQLGVIEVRDSVIGEPAGPVLVFTNKNRTAIAVIVDGNAAEVTLQPAALQRLETICSG